MKLKEATAIGEKIIRLLEPAVERALLAGSIRRGQRDVNDVEIVAAPRMTARPNSLFPGATEPATESHVDRLVQAEPLLEFDPHTRRNGRRYKRLLWDRRIGVDLFLVLPPASFGAIFALRTGPGDFSRRLVMRRSRGGAMPDALQLKDGALWGPGGRIDTPDEASFFAVLGLPHWQPRDRDDDALCAFIANHSIQGGNHAGVVAKRRRRAADRA